MASEQADPSGTKLQLSQLQIKDGSSTPRLVSPPFKAKQSEVSKPSTSTPPIRRRYSCRVTPFGYTLDWCLNEPSAADATIKRTALMRDWIDNHEFSEPSVEAMDLVDWEQILPHERVLALHHAETRALAAVTEYEWQVKATPHQSGVIPDPLTLGHFADKNSGDSDEQNVIIGLPDFHDPNLESDSRIPRTIVVFAKIYHRVLVLKEVAAQEIGQWIIFKAWLHNFTAKELLKLGLSDRILKEGAVYVVKSINRTIMQYNAVRDKIVEKCGDDVAIQSINSVHDIPPPPMSGYDLCSAKTRFIRRLKLLSQSKKTTRKLLKQRKPAALRKDFEYALTFRVGTLDDIKGQLEDLEEMAAELGVELNSEPKEKAEGSEISDEDWKGFMVSG